MAQATLTAACLTMLGNPDEQYDPVMEYIHYGIAINPITGEELSDRYDYYDDSDLPDPDAGPSCG